MEIGLSSFLEYEFMRNALFAILIITPLFAIMGTMIVNNKMAFFSEALGHSALTGIAIGGVLGVTDTNLTMTIFAILFALLLNYISSKNTASTDFVFHFFLPFFLSYGNKYEINSRQEFKSSVVISAIVEKHLIDGFPF